MTSIDKALEREEKKLAIIEANKPKIEEPKVVETKEPKIEEPKVDTRNKEDEDDDFMGR